MIYPRYTIWQIHNHDYIMILFLAIGDSIIEDLVATSHTIRNLNHGLIGVISLGATCDYTINSQWSIHEHNPVQISCT